MGFWGKIARLTKGLFFLVMVAEPARAEKPKEPSVPEVPAEVKPPPPPTAGGASRIFPRPHSPSTIGTIEEGPVSGLLAPYGNTTAYDSLLRGWHCRKTGSVTLTPYL